LGKLKERKDDDDDAVVVAMAVVGQSGGTVQYRDDPPNSRLKCNLYTFPRHMAKLTKPPWIYM
jgi:hypothetical protein